MFMPGGSIPFWDMDLGGECGVIAGTPWMKEGRIGEVMVVVFCFRDQGQRVRVITRIQFEGMEVER